MRSTILLLSVAFAVQSDIAFSQEAETSKNKLPEKNIVASDKVESSVKKTSDEKVASTKKGASNITPVVAQSNNKLPKDPLAPKNNKAENKKAGPIQVSTKDSKGTLKKTEVTPVKTIEEKKKALSGTAAINTGADAIPDGQELVNIDFPELTEIKDIVRAVGLWTGKNVIMDRQVTGKVQMISPKKVTKEEAYQAFLSALNLLGLTTVETGKFLKIMPVRTAVKGNLRTFVGDWAPKTDELITQIIPLKYVDAKKIQSTLSRLVNSNAMLAYEETNTLIISDSGYKVQRILDILEILDVKGQQRQLEMVPIRFADAKSIAEKVQTILKSSGGASAKKGAASFHNYKIITDERSNSVIIYGPPRTIADVKSIVKKFDVRIDDPSRQSTIHVRPLDYADAKKLASTLSNLASSGKSSRRRSPVRSNSKSKSKTNTDVVASLSEDVKITADESSNSLLITGSRSSYEALNSIIRKLDVRRSQVFIEADILDLKDDGGFKFGSSVFGGSSAGGQDIATTWEGGNMSGLIKAQALQSSGTSTSASVLSEAVTPFASDLTIGVISGDKITIPGFGEIQGGALIKMIKEDTNTRVLSSPHLLTSNNEKAVISVGEKIYFETASNNATTGTSVPKIESADVALTLEIEPKISHSNYLTLDINLEADTLGKGIGNSLPSVNTRKSKQIVTVKNGQMVVVSGLVQNQEVESYKKIPLLGDIPILGWLFRNSDIRKIRSNLMIFLKPYIIHGADDLAAIYEQKLKERDEFLDDVYGWGYDSDDFYKRLSTLEEGRYRADAIDEAEENKIKELKKEFYKDIGVSAPAEASENIKTVKEIDSTKAEK